MILSGDRINQLVQSDGMIDPFDMNNLNPASYNFTLGDQVIMLLPDQTIDTKNVNKIIYTDFRINEFGFTFLPNRLYLGFTKEKLVLPNNIGATAEGRSSTARLGMSLHLTAGWCDPGFEGNVTLEISVLNPITIYPNMKCGQFIFMDTDATTGYHGSYQQQPNRPVPTAGRFYS